MSLVITNEAMTIEYWRDNHSICFWQREEMSWCVFVGNQHGQGRCPLSRVADPGQPETRRLITHCIVSVCQPRAVAAGVSWVHRPPGSKSDGWLSWRPFALCLCSIRDAIFQLVDEVAANKKHFALVTPVKSKVYGCEVRRIYWPTNVDKS
jgi:hypothetical protein